MKAVAILHIRNVFRYDHLDGMWDVRVSDCRLLPCNLDRPSLHSSVIDARRVGLLVWDDVRNAVPRKLEANGHESTLFNEGSTTCPSESLHRGMFTLSPSRPKRKGPCRTESSIRHKADTDDLSQPSRLNGSDRVRLTKPTVSWHWSFRDIDQPATEWPASLLEQYTLLQRDASGALRHVG